MPKVRGGLERVALDLHVHTPASHDWRGPKPSPAEFVQAIVSKGLHGIAVTDHATGGWIDALRVAAIAADIVIFPGVELNNLAGNEGIHIVAIFETDFTEIDVDRFLTTVGALSGAGKRVRRGSATAGPIQVLNAVHEFGGIAVLAHCASGKGALGGMRGDLRTQIVQHPALLAAEAPPDDFHDETKRKLGKRTWDVLDGQDPTYLRELAVYSASDNPSAVGHGHGLGGIGTRYSYFWMEQPLTLEGLRQCLIDRRARIEIPIPAAPISNLPPRQTQSIGRVQVTGGYLNGLDVVFHEGLTTILGAKGSGKSMLVELLRFALGQQPTQIEILRDHETKLRKRLEPYGRVAVDIRQSDGGVVTLEREHDPAKQNPWRSAVTPTDLVGCHFLSQGEVVRIAESEEEQIRFIDSFFDFRTHQKAIAKVRSQLVELDKDVAKQIANAAAEEQLLADKKRISAEIAEKNRLVKSRGFTQYQRAQAKSRLIEGALSTASKVLEVLDDAREALNAVPNAPAAAGASGRDAIVRRALKLADELRNEAVESLARTTAAARLSSAAIKNDQETWEVEFAKEEDAYSKEVQKAGGDQRALNQARARLERELADVETKLSSASQLARQLKPRIEKRDALLGSLRDLRRKYTRARQERCEWFEEKSEGQIKARVSAGSNRDEFQDRLAAMKKGSYLAGAETEAIASSVSPEAFVEALLAFGKSSDPRSLKGIATASKLPESRVIALAGFLLEQASREGFERLLEVQHAVSPTDRPEIRFRREDGSYAPLSELSTGQKCTALLVMALAEGDRPIIIDQPEDSLDVRSIWEDMCVRLRLAKRSRQFVFTTHNSSLAVASDSDTFIVMAGGADRGEVVLAGAIDHEEVRDEVIKLLEGGPSTYFLKQRKYHISDPYSG